MQRGYADTPEGQIHYHTHGRGDPLLLLHEVPRSALSFMPLMKRLGGRFRCFAPDTLGFGGSDALPAKATMEDLAHNMIHFLDRQGIRRAHVLGFHTGNKIAAAMAAGYPDRVGKAVLIGMTRSLVISRKHRDAAIMNIVRKYMTAYRESPDGAHLVRAWAADYGSLAGIWWDPALMTGRKVTAAALRRIKLPALVIECCVPEEAHLGAQGPALVRLLKRGELVTLKNAGFDAADARAADIARAASRFLLKG